MGQQAGEQRGTVPPASPGFSLPPFRGSGWCGPGGSEVSRAEALPVGERPEARGGDAVVAGLRPGECGGGGEARRHRGLRTGTALGAAGGKRGGPGRRDMSVPGGVRGGTWGRDTPTGTWGHLGGCGGRCHLEGRRRLEG